MSIGKKIKELRLSKKLTLRELGDQLNVNYSHLSKVESGKRNPSLELIEIIAKFFDVPMSCFFDAAGDEDEFTESEKELLEIIDLPLEEIRQRINPTFEGRSLSDEEFQGMLAWLKAKRSIE